MFDSVRAGSMVTKTAKVVGGLGAGGTTLALVVNMFGARLEDLNRKIDDKDKEIRAYVDFRHDQVIREMMYIRDSQSDIKDILKTIEHRMYANKLGG